MNKSSKNKKLNCTKCFDTGYLIQKKDGLSYSRPCICLINKKKEYHFNSMNIPRSMMDKNLDNFICNNKSHEKTIKFLQEYTDKYPHNKYGLLFMGPAGVGKTHLAIGVIKAIALKTDDKIMFTDTSALLKSIKQTIGDKFGDDPAPDILKEICDVPILLLDDLGSQKISMWTQDTIKLVINHRYNNNLLTFITTPYLDKPKAFDKEKLEQRIGEINRSRLYEMCKTIMLDGEDFRKLMINPRLI